MLLLHRYRVQDVLSRPFVATVSLYLHDGIYGVDTHTDQHVAVAIDRQSVRLGPRRVLGAIREYEELSRLSRVA